MKLIYTKIIFSISFMFIICIAKSQTFTNESLQLNIGTGIGGYLTYNTFGDSKSAPLLFIAVDKGLVEDIGPGNIGIGGFMAYKSSSYEYQYFGFTDKGKWNNFVIGARGTYHYTGLSNDKIDLYGALHIGVVIETYKYTTDAPPTLGFVYDYDYTDSFLYYSFNVGGKYFFTEQFAAFAELGYDIAWIKVGLTINI